MRRLWVWLAGHQFVAAVALFTLVVAGAFIRDQVRAAQDRQFIQCVAAWGDQVTTRSSALTPAGSARADALDSLLRNVFEQISTGRNDPAQFRERLAGYVAASDNYQRVQRDNPVPAPPRIRC